MINFLIWLFIAWCVFTYIQFKVLNTVFYYTSPIEVLGSQLEFIKEFKKPILNIILLTSIGYLLYHIYTDINSQMSMRQWFELMIFEFLIQGILEFNLRK